MQEASPQPAAAVQGCPGLARNPQLVLQYLVALLPPLLAARSLHCPGPAALGCSSAVLPPPGTCHGLDTFSAGEGGLLSSQRFG